MNFFLKLSIILILSNIKVVLAADYTNVILNIENKNWIKAEELASNYNDSALSKLVISQKFLDNTYSRNNFAEIVKFLKANPHWPQQEKLKKAAESYLDYNTNKEIIFSWFSQNRPITGKGYKFYAASAAKFIKDQAQLKKIIRQCWVYGDFSLAEEKQFFKDYSKYLKEKDHIARITEHLWKEDIKEALRSLKLVSKNYQAAFNAEIAIIRERLRADYAFRQVNPKYYTSGLLYKYLLLKKKMKLQPDQFMYQLLQNIPVDPGHAEQWAKLQFYYAREFLEQKNYPAAYNVISKHFATKGDEYRENEWLAGWIALSFLHKPELAIKHFENFKKVVKSPMSLSRAYYWLGRSNAALKRHDEAKKFYLNAAHLGHSFYGQIATLELGKKKLNFPSKPKVENHHTENIKKNEIFRAMRILMESNKRDLAHLYAKVAIEQLKDPAEIVLVTDFVKKHYDVHYAVTTAKTAVQHHVLILNDAYPTPYKISNSPIEAALTYAIMRQESVFNKSAISSQKAMGLMQLIKTTACGSAKSVAIKCDIPKLTQDAGYNIKLGANHLKDLLEYREGSYILSIASYNTDPKHVSKWIRLYGDPREYKSLHKVIDWLELIPFTETRNYVQRVLENLQIYRTILHKDNRFNLDKDLLG